MPPTVRRNPYWRNTFAICVRFLWERTFFCKTSPIRRLFVFWRGGARELSSSDFGFCVNVPFSPCSILFFAVGRECPCIVAPYALWLAHRRARFGDGSPCKSCFIRVGRVPTPRGQNSTCAVMECAVLCSAVGASCRRRSGGVNLAHNALVHFVCLQDGKIKISSNGCVRGNTASALSKKRSQRPAFIATAKRQTETDGFEKMIRSILFGVDEGLHLPLSHVGTSSKTPCTLAVSAAIMNFSKHSSFIFIVKRRKDAQILTRYSHFLLKIAYSEQNRKKIIILATFFENHLYKAVFLWYNVCGIMRRP